MSWTLDTVRIFVQEDNLEGGQIIPRLQPISGGTVLQIFGYESPIKTIVGIIVGLTDATALVAMSQDAETHTLTSAENVVQNLYVNKVSLKRLPTVYQTLRTDLACDAPVYQFSVTFG